MRVHYVSFLALAILIVVGFSGSAAAHTPICACYDNGDGTVLCEGGFSDGSSAAGVGLHVKDAQGNVILEGKMSEDSEFSFDKPKDNFTVLFDAGPGHQIEISSRDIVK